MTRSRFRLLAGNFRVQQRSQVDVILFTSSKTGESYRSSGQFVPARPLA